MMAGNPARILIVDDEPKITDVVGSYLRNAGYEPLIASTGAEALVVFARVRPVLVILDLMLPDLTGEEVCRKLREGSRVPIIMLTAKSADSDAVHGLALGADDYVVKPFSPRQLMARVEAVLRRASGGDAPTARVLSFNDDDLIIDDLAGLVRKAGSKVDVTPSEFRLLRLLAGNPGRLFTREELITRVLGDDFNGYDRTIDAHVKNLRQKIESTPRDPCYIHTVHGMGYRFAAEKRP
jgi:DNA-binding response OmpR family regulator